MQEFPPPEPTFPLIISPVTTKPPVWEVSIYDLLPPMTLLFIQELLMHVVALRATKDNARRAEAGSSQRLFPLTTTLLLLAMTSASPVTLLNGRRMLLPETDAPPAHPVI